MGVDAQWRKSALSVSRNEDNDWMGARSPFCNGLRYECVDKD